MRDGEDNLLTTYQIMLSGTFDDSLRESASEHWARGLLYSSKYKHMYNHVNHRMSLLRS